MKYYLQVKNDKILSYSMLPVMEIDVKNVEIAEQVYNEYKAIPERFYVENGEIKSIPIEEIEKERINSLTMTALDFVNFLKLAGLTDLQIEQYLNANLSIKHQLQFCQNVYCGVAKALMPITFEGVTITAEMVEQAFKQKHGV